MSAEAECLCNFDIKSTGKINNDLLRGVDFQNIIELGINNAINNRDKGFFESHF